MMITLRRLKLQKLLIVLVLSGLLMSCGGSENKHPLFRCTLHDCTLHDCT